MAIVARCWRLGLAICLPLLVAASCDEAKVTIPYAAFLTATVGHQVTAIVRVVNSGGVDAKLGEISNAALGLAPPFSLVGGTCVSGGIIPKSYGECTLEIAFSAAQAKQYSSTFQLTYTWGDGTKKQTASNTVNATAYAPISANWLFGPFENRPLDSVTEAALTVFNAGTYAVTLADVSSGHLALTAPFSAVGGTCLSGASLAPNSSCTLNVRFVPTTVGRFEDEIEFDYNWPGSGVTTYHHSSLINGSSLPPVALSASPAALPLTSLGQSAIQTITVKNSGGQPAVLGTIDDAGVGIAAPFSLRSGTCRTGLALAPNGGTCTFDVAFSPAAAGAANDVLELRYGWGGIAGAFTLRHSLFASGVGAGSGDCFATGCAAGQVCSRIASGTDAGTCVSVPNPPEGCMAPCVWEARRACLPVMGACATEDTLIPGSPVSPVHTVCDTRTGWAVRGERYYEGTFALDSFYRKNGVTCFGSQVDPGLAPQIRYSDGTGPIAVSDVNFNDLSTRSVWCGPYTSIVGLDRAASYTEFPRTPECVAWQVTYLDATNCRSQTPGSCQGL